MSDKTTTRYSLEFREGELVFCERKTIVVEDVHPFIAYGPTTGSIGIRRLVIVNPEVAYPLGSRFFFEYQLGVHRFPDCDNSRPQLLPATGIERTLDNDRYWFGGIGQISVHYDDAKLEYTVSYVAEKFDGDGSCGAPMRCLREIKANAYALWAE